MASNRRYSSLEPNRAPPRTPHARSRSVTPFQTPVNQRSVSPSPSNPFQDPVTPASPTPSSPEEESVASTPLPFPGRLCRGIPRERTYQSFPESVADMSTIASEDEGEAEAKHERGFGATQGNLYASSSPGYSQLDLHFSVPELSALRHDYSVEGQAGEGFHTVTQEHVATDTRGAFQYSSQLKQDSKPSIADMESPAQTLPAKPQRSHKKTTHRRQRYTTQRYAENPWGPVRSPKAPKAPEPVKARSPLTSSISMVTPPSRAFFPDSSPQRPQHVHPALRQGVRTLHHGFSSLGRLPSSISLSREVREREARLREAREQDVRLEQERAREEEARTPLHSGPSLHPSPIALKVAVQLIRDSPAGQLPVGNQAVLHSRCIWIGIGIAEVGAISLAAAITAASFESIYSEDGQATESTMYWLSISTVAVLGGLAFAAVMYARKMGFWVDNGHIRRLGEINLVDRLVHVDRSPERDLEMGVTPESIRSSASSITRLRGGRGLYANSRYGYSTFNSLNPEWQELYMSPEQLRDRMSHPELRTVDSTPSRAGSREHGLLSSGPSLIAFNEASAEPLQPEVTSPVSSPNPFADYPTPRTPYVPVLTSFASPPTQTKPEQNEEQGSPYIGEVGNWSPLENIMRDVNSEHVRNMPIEQRRDYIIEQRTKTVGESRKLTNTVVRSHFASAPFTTSFKTADSPSPRPGRAGIEEVRRGRVIVTVPTTPVGLRTHESHKATVVGISEEEGIEMNAFGSDARGYDNGEGSNSSRKVRSEDRHHRRQSGGFSVEKVKKIITMSKTMSKTGFRQLDGQSVFMEAIDPLVQKSKQAKATERAKAKTDEDAA